MKTEDIKIESFKEWIYKQSSGRLFPFYQGKFGPVACFIREHLEDEDSFELYFKGTDVFYRGKDNVDIFLPKWTRDVCFKISEYLYTNNIDENKRRGEYIKVREIIKICCEMGFFS